MIRRDDFSGEIRYMVQGNTMILDWTTTLTSLSEAERAIYLECGGRFSDPFPDEKKEGHSIASRMPCTKALSFLSFVVILERLMFV